MSSTEIVCIAVELFSQLSIADQILVTMNPQSVSSVNSVKFNDTSAAQLSETVGLPGTGTTSSQSRNKSSGTLVISGPDSSITLIRFDQYEIFVANKQDKCQSRGFSNESCKKKH